MFDDFHNLEPLGTKGGIDSVEDLSYFVFGGGAGPLGRPISLATFVLDAQGWPADPYAFKRTNVLLHMLCGVLLLLFARMVALELGFGECRATIAGLIIAAIWLLHPMQQATFFPVVQRMTQLSALFMIAGLSGWMAGRRRLLDGRVLVGYVWMTGALVIGTVFSTLSKENGALLPLVILVLSSTLAQVPSTAPGWKVWRGCFLVAPSLAVFCYLAFAGISATSPFPARDFGPWERLVSQPAIIASYVYEFAVPNIRTSPYSDYWQASSLGSLAWRDWVATIGCIILLGCAVLWRKSAPLFAFAVLGFIAPQLIESGPISLELRFPHRTYLAIAFVVIPVVLAGLTLPPSRVRLATFALLSYVVLCAAVGALSSRNWGDPYTLFAGWAKERPESLRAQTSAAGYWLSNGRPESAGIFVDAAQKRFPSSPALAFQEYWIDCTLGYSTQRSWDALFHKARVGARENFTFPALSQTELLIRDGFCPELSLTRIAALAEQFLANANYQDTRAQGLLGWRLHKIYMQMERPGLALEFLELALKDRVNETLLLAKADALAKLGQYERAAMAVEDAIDHPPLSPLGKAIIRSAERVHRLTAVADELRRMNRVVE